MTLKKIITIALVAGGVAWGISIMRNPYRTALPFGTTDLSSIQTQLDRLPEDDRALVVGYVERSNGDVLPAAFADPDMPFTARTVSEAIELQKNS